MSGTTIQDPADTGPVAAVPLRRRFGRRWQAGLAVAGAGVVLLGWTVGALLWWGIGLWGTNIPFVWGFDLINYIWWVGIGNAASLFAAVLVLRRHGLRTAVNRFAEAAALAAVFSAALFPILHLGRPWLFLWVFPYPATYAVWPQFRSPLIWDFWGIMAHVVVTGLFWYTGLIPDLATLRDLAMGRPRLARIYGVLALGWRGSVRHWIRHQAAYRLVAGLVLPMLVAAQSAVALEFATTLVPGWHQARLVLQVIITGLPSGLGIILLLAVLLRRGLGLEQYIDDRDMDLLARLLAASGIACFWVYLDGLWVMLMEDPETHAAAWARVTGPYAPLYWGAVALAALLPQALWLPLLRRHDPGLAAIGLAAVAGIWLDRFSLVVGGLTWTYLPQTHGLYAPSGAEGMLMLGTIGLFATLLLLFARSLPAVSMFETRHEESSAEREKEEP